MSRLLEIGNRRRLTLRPQALAIFGMPYTIAGVAHKLQRRQGNDGTDNFDDDDRMTMMREHGSNDDANSNHCG